MPERLEAAGDNFGGYHEIVRKLGMWKNSYEPREAFER